jgi:hypothetical protein
MSLRSVVAAAALVLTLAGAPALMNFAPHEAMAAETDTATAAKAVLSDNTPVGNLDRKTLRQHIKALRAAIKDRSLSRAELKQAREKVKAYRAEMRSRRGEKDKAGSSDKDKAKGGGEQAPASGGSNQQQPPAATGGNQQAPAAGNESKSGDDTLAGQEAAPFTEALKSSGAPSSGSDGTIKRPDFMAACTKGAFKDLM